MGIEITYSNIHWNYFLALESDMANVARYIEFSEANFDVYSIELAHLLFAACSEFEVVTKQLCKILDRSARAENINDYRTTILAHAPDILKEEVQISKFGVNLKAPLEKWGTVGNPLWWGSYNKVKHSRHQHFKEATLKNALNALAALFIALHYYHKESNGSIFMSEVIKQLKPSPTLFQLRDDDVYYFIK